MGRGPAAHLCAKGASVLGCRWGGRLVTRRGCQKPARLIALTLGVAFIPIAVELTCYYYAVLLALGFLWLRYRWIGVGLCVLSAFTNVVPVGFGMSDDIHATISVLIVVFVLAVMSSFAVQDAARKERRVVVQNASNISRGAGFRRCAEDASLRSSLKSFRNRD